jgi:hypothetical protein
MAADWPPNGLELSCPAEAGRLPLIVAHPGGPYALPFGPARRVSRRPFVPDVITGILVSVQGFSELLGRPVELATNALP